MHKIEHKNSNKVHKNHIPYIFLKAGFLFSNSEGMFCVCFFHLESVSMS